MSIGHAKPVLIATAAGLAALCVGGYVWGQDQRPHVLEVYVFSLPNGRAIFVRTPNDKRYLIDGGSNSGIIRKITSILPFYSRRIDGIIATGNDKKNVTGLIEVIKRYQVTDAYVPAITRESIPTASPTDEAFEILLQTITDHQTKLNRLYANDTFFLDEKNSLNIIFPLRSGSFEYTMASPPELLWRMSYQNTSVLFMGESSKKIQKVVASSTSFSHSDVLIFSKSAFSDNLDLNFISKVNPDYLIHSKAISSKKSNTKDELFKSLENVRMFNLKEGKSIKITSDGSNITIEPI